MVSRYIQDFAKISRPLSYLTKKKVKWQWGFDQQNAFQTLKNSLTTPPVLKQADGTKPYIIRTDASNYALGAVLLQGEGSDEHPIEYASRLLTPAERNYSTTEREALAVVWALKKFRGYIEGTEITVASDHQPLKWLLNLKSPTGRLAKWAHEIQSFNLKVQYIPGKANVVANMFQARRLLQQQFPTEPSIPQQELLLQQLIMSPRRDVVRSIGEINLDYIILDGARRQERRWDPTQNEQVVPEDKEVSKRLSTDSMFCLEHNVNDKIKQKTILPSLQKLEESKEIWKDDYLLNKALRQQFREKKKEIATIEDKDKQLLKKCSLDIALLPETDEDRKLAGLLKLAPLHSFEEKEKLKREESLSRPLFPNSSNMPTLANSIRESKIKTLLKPLNKSELGISVKICKGDTMKSENGGTSKSVKTNDVKTSLVAFDYDSSESDEEKT
ncbi:coiled-coil domain-containing protein 130 homolog [Trichonephila clavipes]|uniref:Coiled-coil domain-containing protein 130 homolog n=1 Tax=Trichonephila clavipes TaxID=2585209 RepID=A0A8X6WIZ4_TRICX|nr:coiled-coil domain-containing protein 130 homolog [Trichonephila clavipes]